MNTTVKLLVPLSTLAVATAVVVGSGATWTSTTESTITATAGTLVQANTQNNATLAVTNLEPGSTQTGSLTITNTGDLDGVLTLTGASTDDQFVPGAVTLTVKKAGVTIWTGNFGDIDDIDTDLTGPDTAKGIQAVAGSALATGANVGFDFTVAMAANASHTNQGKSADVDLSFVLTQDGVDESEKGWSGTPAEPGTADNGTPGTTP